MTLLIDPHQFRDPAHTCCGTDNINITTKLLTSLLGMSASLPRHDSLTSAIVLCLVYEKQEFSSSVEFHKTHKFTSQSSSLENHPK